MRIRLLISESAYRRWHDDLAHRLRDHTGIDVEIELKFENPLRARRKLEMVLALERRIHRMGSGGLARGNLARASARQICADDVDVVVDLTDTPLPGHWKVLYDGVAGEHAAVSALRAGRQPIVSVIDSAGRVRAEGRPGRELPGLHALADIGAGTATLIVGAVVGSPFAPPIPDDTAARVPQPFSWFAARHISKIAIKLTQRLAFRVPHWRVGWRLSAGPDLLTTGTIPAAGWRNVPDDGFHFYADPFLLERDGSIYLFVEDLDHRIGKGVISVTEMEHGDFASAPRQILSHEVHLSYP